jgi:hypothetical protein
VTDAPHLAAALGRHRTRALALTRLHGRTALAYLGAFGAAKSIVVIGPILLAKLYAPGVYGAIELALSTSLFIAMLTMGAVTGGVPRLSLSRSPVKTDDVTAAAIAVWGVALLILAGGVYKITGQGPMTLCILATIPAMAQGAMNTHLIVASRRATAAVSSAFATIVASCTVIGLTFGGAMTVERLLTIYAVSGIGIASAAALWATRRLKPQFSARARQAVTVGLPILAYSLVATWIAASGRLYVATFLSVEAVAVYAFDFRIAAMALLPYGLITAGLFAQVYSLKTRRFDRLAPRYLGVTALFGTALTAAFPLFLAAFAPKALPLDSRVQAAMVFILVMGQVIGWTISASIFIRINRAGLAGRAATATALVAACTALLVLGLARFRLVALENIALVLMVQEYAQIAALLGLLWRKGLPLPRLAALSFIVAASVLGLYLVRTIA